MHQGEHEGDKMLTPGISQGNAWGIRPAAFPSPVSQLRIVYNNDTHEHWDGFAKSVTGFQAMSQQGAMQGRDVLRLNGGDNNTGGEAREWELNVRLLNLLGLHGTTMGNHEFDLAPNTFVNAISRFANFPTLVSNLKVHANSLLTHLVRNGQLTTNARIVQGQQGAYGLLGITSTQKQHGAIFDEGNTTLNFDTTCRELQQQVDQLRRQGINRIILMSHMGYNHDRKLAQAVSGISVIVGGDSHTDVHGITPGQNFVQAPDGNPVLIMQAGANSKYVGVADLAFDAQGRVIPQSNTLYPTDMFPENPFALQLMQQYLPPKQVVANVLNRYDHTNNQKNPSGLAQFNADVIRKISGADIGFVHSREIRKSIEAGPLTNWEIKQIMPYQDSVVKISSSGADIMKALQRSAQGILNKNGNRSPLLNASGLACTMNPFTGEVKGASIFNNQKQKWEALNPQKTYSVAINEYVVRNNKEFPEFGHPERISWRSNMPLRSIFTTGLGMMGAPYAPVVLKPADKRLTIENTALSA
jgi:5'-nucleotidase / UDP-sugar diphosphatase